MSSEVPEKPVEPTVSPTSQKPEIATFGGGCFWGVEHIFLEHYPFSENRGILKTSVGYTGGKETSTNPSYLEVCTGATDHAEAIRIEFDASVVSYAELMESFYRTHDPTTVNRQGPKNVGRRMSWISATRPVTTHFTRISVCHLHTHSQEQRTIALDVTNKVQDKYFTPKNEKIVTEVQEAGPWYDAEDYHQLYLFKNPSGHHCPTHHLHW